MTFDPVNPIDGIFTAIDDLVSYADAANSPYYQAQVINMAYIIKKKKNRYLPQVDSGLECKNTSPGNMDRL